MLPDLALLSPLLIVTLMGLLVLMAGVFSPTGTFKGWLGYLTVLGFAAALGATWWIWTQLPVELHGQLAGALVIDGFGLAMSAIILVGAALTTLTAVHYLPAQKSDHAEYYALVSFAVAGMMGLVQARGFLTLFVSLEVMSIAVYILAGFKRQSAFSIEAALKYFIMGSFASALLLLGFAYLYGVTGTLDIADIGRTIRDTAGVADNPMTTFAMVLVLAAFAFKIAAAPFHMWVPDVYEGAPSSVSGFMAIAVKTAGFGAFARVLLTAFGDESMRGGVNGAAGWEALVAGLAVVSMVGGNLMALRQRSLKRMLAYSAIVHTGYILIALITRPSVGGADIPTNVLGSGLIFYLLAYTFANAGAFAVAAAVAGDGVEDINDQAYAGLAKRRPWLALVLTVSILSLLGIPATAGFMGKLTIFTEALSDAPVAQQAGHSPHLLWLILIAVINSAVSAWYYLRVLVIAYFHDEARTIPVIRSTALAWAAGLAAIGTLTFGLLPSKGLSASLLAGHSLAGSAPTVSGAPTPGGASQATADDATNSKVQLVRAAQR